MNQNFPSFNPFNALPINYQMLAMSSFPMIQLPQWNAYQAFSQSLMAPNTLFARNLSGLDHYKTFANGTPSTCVVVDEDQNHSFLGRQESFDERQARLYHQMLKERSFITTKDEGSDDHTNDGKEEEDYHGKIEDDFLGKHGLDDDDDSEFEEKQEPSEYRSVTSQAYPYSTVSKSQVSLKPNLKAQIKDIITFIIDYHGLIREVDLQRERSKYKDDPVLSSVFETLYTKYSNTFKTRAEIVKYITRKAFSTIKNNSKNKVDSNSKEACEALCKRYFQASSEEIATSGVDLEKRERFLQLLFPYQKNSKNKQQDTELIKKLMSSKEFYEDYCLYVKNLDSILEADNNRKLPKFINHVLNCVKKNQIESITKYKRIPWLKSWISNTKSLAKELTFSIQWKGQQQPGKQVKRETTTNKENFE